jgi:alpha-beta hydrolase superfamily lysophospholipase
MITPELQFLTLESLAGDTRSIAYRFLQPKGPAPVYLWCGGFKSDMESTKALAIETWASECGAGSLRFDYSGHGQSGGRFEEATLSDWIEEAAALYEKAAAGGYSVVLVGSSMGGFIALRLIEERQRSGSAPPLAAVLIAPAWNMTRLMWGRASEDARAQIMREGLYLRPSQYGPEPYPITKKLIEDGERHCFQGDRVEIRCPIRILQGMRDPDVPWEHVQKLVPLLSGDDVVLNLIKDGEHRLSRPQDIRQLLFMLEEFLNPALPATA